MQIQYVLQGSIVDKILRLALRICRPLGNPTKVMYVGISRSSKCNKVHLHHIAHIPHGWDIGDRDSNWVLLGVVHWYTELETHICAVLSETNAETRGIDQRNSTGVDVPAI
jgi:hypothetical protein